MYTIYVVFKSVPGKREEYIKKLYEEGKKKYEELKLFVVCFEEADILTNSLDDNLNDNTGDWVGGWEDILGKLQ